MDYCEMWHQTPKIYPCFNYAIFLYLNRDKKKKNLLGKSWSKTLGNGAVPMKNQVPMNMTLYTQK